MVAKNRDDFFEEFFWIPLWFFMASTPAVRCSLVREVANYGKQRLIFKYIFFFKRNLSFIQLIVQFPTLLFVEQNIKAQWLPDRSEYHAEALRADDVAE